MDAEATWYRVSTKAVVIKASKLLFVKEGTDLWDLPGGGLEHNETTVEGLAREVQEELGVHVKTNSDLPIFVWKTYDEANKRPIIVLGYKVELASEDFVLQEPVRDIAFIDPAALTTNDFEPYVRDFYRNILKLV
ncbi:MAG: NUDIX hydrolase [Candidatus Saccharibacteria bacterium]